MADSLLSVGLDIGTTTTQMVVSRLQIENTGSSFTVPRLQIADRQILYQSPVYFTPLAGKDLVDADSLRQIIEKEYHSAGITRSQIDTGAIIITGETSRRENARAVSQALSEFAGDFVVATAGPDLESVLAARGAGAVDYSRQTGQRVLHFDIGGGTSNLALIEDGVITATGCLNIGGRLIKHAQGRISYVSPVLTGLTTLQPGDLWDTAQAMQLCRRLAQALEMAAGLRREDRLLSQLTTRGTTLPDPRTGAVISFSGGVADCIDHSGSVEDFGDLGPLLGQAIQESRLCQGQYRLGDQTIRATVIGAGCYSAQLSGSTVYTQNTRFPLKTLPAVCLNMPLPSRQELLNKQQLFDTQGVLFLKGLPSPSYSQICQLADTIANASDGPVYVAVEQDMAKALGQAIALRVPPDRPILCIDGVRLQEGDYLDVATPIGPALPVIVKTLLFETS